MSVLRYTVPHGEKIIDPELLYISHSRYGSDWASTMHSHSTSEMMLILEGKGEIKTMSCSWAIQKGDFLIIPPHFIHTETSDADEPLEYFVLGVSNMSIVNLPEDYNPLVHLGSSREDVLALLTSIYKEMQRKKEGHEMMAKSYLLQLIVLLVRRNKIDLEVSLSTALRQDIAEVKQYIDDHFVEQISIDTLADLSYISKFHLIREFKKELGTSPIEYQLEKRITEAKHLLSATDLSVQDIASNLGFCSSSYFSQRFKKITGMSPLDFKKTTHTAV